MCLFVASTGFFHGYDNGVVNGVFEMSSFRTHMGWPHSDDPDAQTALVALQQGLTVNGFNGGAALSALLFGYFLVDVKGRRPALWLGAVLFAIGGFIQAVSPDAATLIFGRLVAGVGVGLTSSSGTAYIAEVAPASSRGAMVGGDRRTVRTRDPRIHTARPSSGDDAYCVPCRTVYQNNVCIAIVLAAVLNWLVKNHPRGWQVSLGLQAAMGGAVCVGLCFLPETPRFLAKAGRLDDARKVLVQLRGDDATAQAELDGIMADLQRESAVGEATWREIFCENPTFRNVVIIGCGVQFAQIITGINALVSFSGTLFTQLGVAGITAALLPFVAFLLGNMLGSFLLVDRLGRRPLLIWGMAGMAAALLVAGLANVLLEDAGAIAIGCVILYMACFGASWGFGAWLYIPEIMPLRIRGKAVGLCTFVNWGPANISSAFLTPWMLQRSVLGAGGTLLFFGLVATAFVPLALLCLPETKRKPLEQILPSFAFSGWAGLRRFLWGNLLHGEGANGELDRGLAAHDAASRETR